MLWTSWQNLHKKDKIVKLWKRLDLSKYLFKARIKKLVDKKTYLIAPFVEHRKDINHFWARWKINKKYSAQMFVTRVSRGEAFAVEQKIR